MNYLIYYVAGGDRHRQLAALSVQSLYLAGYTGHVHVVADGPIVTPEAPADLVTFETVGTLDAWMAKKEKAKTALRLDLSSYAAVLLLDADTLAASDPTPILSKIAADPSHLYLPLSSNRRFLGINGLRNALSHTERATVPEAQPMFDSYAVGFVPTPENLELVRAWDIANDAASWPADAMTLNVTLVKTGNLSRVATLIECERLNGQAKVGTVIEHYVWGQHVRMPHVFADRRAQLQRTA
jgi:hypothetical protein